jgi:ArsR family transcriptional regulator
MYELPRCCAPTSDAALDITSATVLAATLKAIADPVRLRIISLLSAHEELCVCDFVEPLGVSQPTVSHHLRTLTEAGILSRRKDGRWAHYRLVTERVAEIAASLSPTEAKVVTTT